MDYFFKLKVHFLGNMLLYLHVHLTQKRHRADDEINHRKIEVLRDGHWLWVQWLNVMVGDIVKVHNNTFFPADLAILSSR
jgi:P-type E1-E2 ATPase